MKLILINPNFSGDVNTPSLGLGFIGTFIRNNSNCEVQVLEPILQKISANQTLELLKDTNIVCLTCYTESRFECFDFCSKIKKIHPSILIIIGGPHVNTLDQKILKNYPDIDILVRGEGEEIILDIVKGVPLKDIAGITWRSGGMIIRNPPRELIRNIDSLKYDHDLILYIIHQWKDPEVPKSIKTLNAIPIISSRGCPFKCSFCAANRLWDNSYRKVSAEEVINRIRELIVKYNIRYFRFFDALFFGNEAEILRFCDLLESNNLEIKFRIDIRVGTKKEVLKRLKEVGCEIVGFGIEAGSDRVLAKINKGISRAQIEDTLRECKKLNIWVVGFLMVSLPDERFEDTMKTYEILKHFDEVNIQIFKIHPNTSFYDELKSKGEIDDEIWFDQSKGCKTPYGNEMIYCKELFLSAVYSYKEGRQFVRLGYAIYNLHKPLHIINKNGILGFYYLIKSLFVYSYWSIFWKKVET